MNKYSFLTVALEKDIKQVRNSIIKFRKYYKNIEYFIITPKPHVEKFNFCLRDFKDINIIDENDIFKKDQFFDICAYYLGEIKKFNLFRKNWYYQQILKLKFFLDDEKFSIANLIIWDADTEPLKKIEFFHRNKYSILYGSDYEYHKNYYICNRVILGEEYKNPKLSFVTQFCALGINERRELKETILNSNKKYGISTDSNYIAHSILHAISKIRDIEPIDGSYFSEYELVGSYIINKKTRQPKKQKKIKFFRNYVDGKLDFIQNIILYFLDYKHITYEEPKFLYKKQNYYNFFKAILIDSKLQVFIILFGKFLKNLKKIVYQN